MTLLDDYAHLRQLADELPHDQPEAISSTIKYAGEEAALVLGHEHPGNDEVAARIARIAETCTQLNAEIYELAELFRQLATPRA